MALCVEPAVALPLRGGALIEHERSSSRRPAVLLSLIRRETARWGFVVLLGQPWHGAAQAGRLQRAGAIAHPWPAGWSGPGRMEARSGRNRSGARGAVELIPSPPANGRAKPGCIQA